MPSGRFFRVFPSALIALFVTSTDSLQAGGGYAGSGYRGGAVAAHSCGGGYYRGGATYASHGAAVAAPGPTYVSHGSEGAYPGAAVVSNGAAHNAYRPSPACRNTNYTGVYGGRTGAWSGGRWDPNYGYYGGGVYVGGVVPYYGSGPVEGAPTIVPAPEQSAAPGTSVQVVYPSAPEQNVDPAPPPAAYPAPLVIPAAAPSASEPAAMSRTRVTVVRLDAPDMTAIEAQQISYQGRKYYSYEGSYFQAHLQGTEVGYNKVAAPAGIPAPPADAPKSVITILAKDLPQT